MLISLDSTENQGIARYGTDLCVVALPLPRDFGAGSFGKLPVLPYLFHVVLQSYTNSACATLMSLRQLQNKHNNGTGGTPVPQEDAQQQRSNSLRPQSCQCIRSHM